MLVSRTSNHMLKPFTPMWLHFEGRPCGGGSVPRSGKWGPLMGLVTLKKRWGRWVLSPRRGQSEKASNYKPEEGPHPEPKLSAFLTPDCLTSRTVGNKCLLLKPPSLRYLSQQPEQVETAVLLLSSSPYSCFSITNFLSSKKKWVRWLDLRTWTRNVRCAPVQSLSVQMSGSCRLQNLELLPTFTSFQVTPTDSGLLKS